MKDISPRWTDPQYESFVAIVRERSGLIFQPMRRTAVETAAARVMQRIGIVDAVAFLPLVAQDGAVFDDLMVELTIGETYFFRESAHFTLLRETILPDFTSRRGDGQKFRAWSAGCSTGEEPYSVAIALREHGVVGTVVGTDVSRARLAAARRAEYRRWSFRGVPEPTIARYFTRQGDTYVLAPDLRTDVDFRYLNLASDCYPSMSAGVWGMDVIFCRNVLIYFDRDTIRHVAKSLLASLSPEGWLLPGATDPPLQDYVRCEVVQTNAGLVYRPYRAATARSIRAPLDDAPAPSVLPALPALPGLPVLPVLSTPRDVAELPPPAAPAPRVVSPAALPAPAPFTVEESYQAHDYERVVVLLQPQASDGSAHAAEYVLLVRALANLGRLGDAGRLCADALDRYRDSAELHYLHAVLLGQGGEFAESARAARRAVYLDRSLIVAYLALGSALASEQHVAAAARAFAAADRLLGAMAPDAIVPGTDGEPAERLREMTRTQARLATRENAA